MYPEQPSRSEQPRQELAGEEREASAEHDAGNLPFRARFAEHKEEPADDDGDQGQRASEWTGEGRLEIERRSFPRALRPCEARGEKDAAERQAPPIQGSASCVRVSMRSAS